MMTATPAKKTRKRSLQAAPPPAPPAPEPLIRVAFEPQDLSRLIGRLGDWDDPIAHRLRLRYSKYVMNKG